MTAAAHSLAFFGDNILSRACHDDQIVMWRIEGFSSADPPPAVEDAPTTYNPSRLTRSAFAPAYTPSNPRQFTRLMSFLTPGCGPQFFMRFRLFRVPGRHPVLAFCNAAGKILFWDLERLVRYHDFKKELGRAAAVDAERAAAQLAADPRGPVPSPPPPPQRPSFLLTVQKRGPRGGGEYAPRAVATAKGYASDRDSAGSDAGARDTSEGQGQGADAAGIAFAAYTQETIASWTGKYGTANAHEPLKAHRVETVGASSFVGRQVAWSPGGEWCVVVGSSNCALVLQRWKAGSKGAAAEGATAGQ